MDRKIDNGKRKPEGDIRYAENIGIPEKIRKIKVEDTTLTAALEDNKTVDALKEYFGKSITLSTSTYGGFERGCILDKKLPTEFLRGFIAPVPGDIMLYGDNEFMIYFGPNSAYRYTRIGKINDTTEDELKALLGGTENIDITFSFEE